MVSRFLRLEFDSWEEKLHEILMKIGNESIDMFGIHSVLIAHRTGSVQPSEPIVFVFM